MKKLIALMTLLLSLSISAQTFYPGQTIYRNKKYFSDGKQYYLIFQDDGNLVVYNRSNNSVWNSRTSNSGSKAEFQSDGNLVIYNNSETPVLSSNTANRGKSLKIQDDGNLVIYDGNNSPIWASNDDNRNKGVSSVIDNSSLNKGYRFVKNVKVFSKNGDYYLVFQNDGNLVVYDRDGNVYWDTNTQNRGMRAEFQSDGNLVVYDRRRQAIFSSNTSGRGGKILRMQDDGNLVIYTSNNNAVWGSNNR